MPATKTNRGRRKRIVLTSEEQVLVRTVTLILRAETEMRREQAQAMQSHPDGYDQKDWLRRLDGWNQCLQEIDRRAGCGFDPDLFEKAARIVVGLEKSEPKAR